MQNYHLVTKFWVDEHRRTLAERGPLHVTVEEKRWPVRPVDRPKVVVRRHGDLLVAEQGGKIVGAIAIFDHREAYTSDIDESVRRLLRRRARQLRQRSA